MYIDLRMFRLEKTVEENSFCSVITHQMHESEQQQTSDFDIMENYNFYNTSPLKSVFQKYLNFTVFVCILFSISHNLI